MVFSIQKTSKKLDFFQNIFYFTRPKNLITFSIKRIPNLISGKLMCSRIQVKIDFERKLIVTPTFNPNKFKSTP